MPTQFLDTRTSQASNTNTGTTVLPVATSVPLLLGDIGLQVVTSTSPDDIRVALWGTIGVTAATISAMNITIERNGTSVSGTGTIIYNALVEVPVTTVGSTLVSFHAADFHPPFPLDGQIRYTMFAIDAAAGSITVTGPVAFSGTAASGTA